MQILGHGPGTGSAVLSNWVGVIVVLLALVMNEATVDSLQNGMAASISGQYLKNLPLVWTRWVWTCAHVYTGGALAAGLSDADEMCSQQCTA